MLSPFLKKTTLGSIYQGLEIFEADGKDSYALLILENRKGELEVVAAHLVDKLEGLLTLVDRKKPLFVTLNTAKVLKKQIPTEAKNNGELLVINAFPNLELGNFHYQILESSEQSVVSIGKKQHIDQYLEQLGKIGLRPFQVSLGISNAQLFEGLTSGVLVGSNFKIAINGSHFQEYRGISINEGESLNFNGISLQNWHLLGFAQILAFLQKTLPTSNLGGMNKVLQIDFKNKRWFDFWN